MTDRETGTINTFYLLTHSHSVSLSDQSFLLLWLDHQIFLSLSLNTEGFQFSQAMIMFPIFIIMRRKKILKCWWSVLFIYCIAALLLTSPLGLICVWMCFSGGFDTAGKVWAFGNVSVEHLYVCFFYKIMNLHQGGQKNGLFLSGERRQTVRDRLLGELWDYSTVSCWTLSWAGRLMWAKTSNAAQHLTKVKHFLSVSLQVVGRFVREKVRWNVKSRVIAWEREILINSLWWSSPATSLMPRVPVWIFHLLLLAFPQRTRLHLQSQPKDRWIQRMQRSKNKQCGYEWQTLSQGCIQTANQSLQHVYKAQASSTEKK